MAALELLPGNLVNYQIKENMYIGNVPDNVKYRLLNEIGSSSCVGLGPLLHEYRPCFRENEATKSSSNVKSSKACKNTLNRELELQIYDTTEAEGKIVCVDLASESIKLSKDPILMLNSADGEVGELDEIEEFVPSLSKSRRNLQDQRLFIFKSFRIPQKERTYNYANDNKVEEQVVSTKTRKASRKRLRKRSVFQENEVMDIEYGDSDEASEQRNKIFVEESRKSNGEIVIYGSNSFPFEQPSRHIHPKLPDYDEIAAKFRALKRANLLSKKTR
ncbi:hypothetical protein ACJIZ3_007407 [Penstemon smallii]|uniref:Uncharacterized protein n=1 Tax=Penstemon smallii TaxID=265156 RepID=A0ABD3SAL9_9LAMI